MFTHHMDCKCCVITSVTVPKGVCVGTYVQQCDFFNIFLPHLLVCVHHLPCLSRLRLFSCTYPESTVKIVINNTSLLPAVCKAHFKDDISAKSGLVFILRAAPQLKCFLLGAISGGKTDA